MPIPAAAWGAIGSIGGSLLGGLFGSSAQSAANRTNIMLAREQMAFQERMSGSAYQRSVQDLERAGLNPMLSIRGGEPASTPPGAKAEVVPKSAQAMSAALIAAQIGNLLAQTRKTKAEAGTAEAIETMTEARVPYSAGQAKTEFDKAWADLNVAKETAAKLGREIQRADLDFEIRELEKGLTKVQLEQLQQLEVRIQTAVARLTELGIPEQQAIAKLYEDLEQYGPAMKLLAMFLKKR